MSYEPKPTPAVDTGATTIRHRNPSAPRVDGIRESFDTTFSGYVPAEWTLDAECTRPGVDPEWFYPTKGGRSTKATRALAVCAQCVVRQTCLEDALAYESGAIATDQARAEAHGVRGGLTEKERRALMHQRKREAEALVRAAVVADYATDMRVEEIAAKHDVALSSVGRWAKEAGLPMRARGGYSHRSPGASKKRQGA